MKKKIAFVTDSTVYLTEELRQHPDVYVVPIIVISEGNEYEDGIDLTSSELYEMIRNQKEVPKTSQPSVGKFVETYEKLKEEYEGAIAIHVSSQLSGTLASSTSGRTQAEFNVEVIDSNSLSFAITEMLEQGIGLANQGRSIEEITQQLKVQASQSKNYILLGKLEQLYKGGRMSGAQFLLGNLLQIKPILSINPGGELDLFERVRSEKRALNMLVDLLKRSADNAMVKKVGIMHGNVEEKAAELKDKINAMLPNVEVIIGEINTSLAVHGGEGTIALFWQEDDKEFSL
ncbi:fatty acid-binding protein DegV [Bacillus coahuilensis m2-6]|uniref:DegV family protein n=1 Tax=Bacillus coahuilensis TaxID=408580 RepID=UPI000750255B|nr:DegV family protein [Bacillus coahuilensis]KUP09795.1 fatty acid-binding protein DegV [Bacillus coahuilensis m2-6]